LTVEEAFGVVIRRLRKERNFSQEKLSHLSNLDRTFISNIEGGKKQPSLISIFALGTALNVSMSSILFEVEFILKLNNPNSFKPYNDQNDLFYGMRTENVIGRICEKYKGSETILFADDDKLINKLMVDLLTNCGYRVISAADGVEALNRYQQFATDIKLVIVDIVMPKKDGISVYREIRQLNPKVHVMLISGYSSSCLQEEDTLQILQKPFSPVEMAKRVRDLLDVAL